MGVVGDRYVADDHRYVADGDRYIAVDDRDRLLRRLRNSGEGAAAGGRARSEAEKKRAGDGQRTPPDPLREEKQPAPVRCRLSFRHRARESQGDAPGAREYART